MTNREEQIKAAIVVTPEAIAFASPKMNQAAERLAWELTKFVDYLQRLYPDAERHEVTILASVVLQSLPDFFNETPEITEQLRECAAEVVRWREG